MLSIYRNRSDNIFNRDDWSRTFLYKHQMNHAPPTSVQPHIQGGTNQYIVIESNNTYIHVQNVHTFVLLRRYTYILSNSVISTVKKIYNKHKMFL